MLNGDAIAVHNSELQQPKEICCKAHFLSKGKANCNLLSPTKSKPPTTIRGFISNHNRDRHTISCSCHWLTSRRQASSECLPFHFTMFRCEKSPTIH